MISQKTIRSWIPQALKTFKTVMPSVSTPYPDFFIASKRSLSKLRDRLVIQTKSPNRKMPDPYDNVMEFIHGDGGSAIMICQDLCQVYLPEFTHFLWHELGHFYAVANERKKFYYFGGQISFPNEIRRTGYMVWNEFIAESIANYVSRRALNTNCQDITDPLCWYPVYNRVKKAIYYAYNTFFLSFDEYSLGQYFATILTDVEVKAFIDAAGKNELLEWDSRNWRNVPLHTNTIDPLALHTIPEQFSGLMLETKALLEKKLAEESFWNVEGKFLDELGSLISELNNQKGFFVLRQALNISENGKG